MFLRISRGMIGGLLLATMLFAAACGSDDDNKGGTPGGGENSCFVQCSDGLASCLSGPGITQAQCQSSGESDCGGTPTAVVLQTGCSCPDFGDPGECPNPPSWYQ